MGRPRTETEQTHLVLSLFDNHDTWNTVVFSEVDESILRIFSNIHDMWQTFNITSKISTLSLNDKQVSQKR